ncbi:class I lanthipeptide [Kordia sp.]|uniref:class I lanthipeptide n=1 Tax=Kordia sp. TaxID=1965332 RepID=UPI003B59D3C9
MKKKKLSKKLDLGKKQISNLGGVQGGNAKSHISCTVGGGNCTSQLIKTCTWYSELYTACTCPPSWPQNCGSQLIRCETSVNFPCEA